MKLLQLVAAASIQVIHSGSAGCSVAEAERRAARRVRVLPPVRVVGRASAPAVGLRSLVSRVLGPEVAVVAVADGAARVARLKPQVSPARRVWLARQGRLRASVVLVLVAQTRARLRVAAVLVQAVKARPAVRVRPKLVAAARPAVRVKEPAPAVKRALLEEAVLQAMQVAALAKLDPRVKVARLVMSAAAAVKPGRRVRPAPAEVTLITLSRG